MMCLIVSEATVFGNTADSVEAETPPQIAFFDTRDFDEFCTRVSRIS